MAALALSGDWAAEFLSGPDSASAPGLTALGDAADADWTREFIAEAAGTLSLSWLLFLALLCYTLETHVLLHVHVIISLSYVDFY